MAINRFDSPAQSNYFNTFVPLPLDQITALGMQRQEDLTRKQDLANKLYDQYALVDYIPNSKDEEYIRGTYLPSLNKAAETMMYSDLTNPVEYAKAMRGLKSLGMADNIRRIEESKQSWSKSQALKQQLIANGKYNPLLDEDPAAGWDSSSGIYSYMPKAYEDKASWLDNYYKGIEPDVSSKVNIDGVNVLRSSISRGQLNRISDSYAQSLSSTPYGKDEITLFRKQNPELASNLSDTQVMKTIMDDYATKYMMHRDQVLPENLQGNGGSSLEGNPVNVIGQEVPGQSMKTDPIGVDEIINNAYATIDASKAEAHLNPQAGNINPAFSVGMPNQDRKGYMVESADMKNKLILSKAYSEAAAKITAEYPDMAFPVGKDGQPNKLAPILSDEQIVNNYKKAQEAWSKTSTLRYHTDNEQVQNTMNSSVATSFSGRTMYFPSLDETLDIKDGFEKLGYTADEAAEIMADPSKAQIKITGPSLNANKAGWYSINIQSKKGKSNRYTEALDRGDVVISGDDDIRDGFEGLYTLKNTIKAGKKEDVPVFYSKLNGSVLYARPNYKYEYKNGKPSLSVELNAYIKDRSGKVYEIEGNPTMKDLYNQVIAGIFNTSTGTRNMNNPKNKLYIK